MHIDVPGSRTLLRASHRRGGGRPRHQMRTRLCRSLTARRASYNCSAASKSICPNSSSKLRGSAASPGPGAPASAPCAGVRGTIASAAGPSARRLRISGRRRWRRPQPSAARRWRKTHSPPASPSSSRPPRRPASRAIAILPVQTPMAQHQQDHGRRMSGFSEWERQRGRRGRFFLFSHDRLLRTRQFPLG